MSKEVLENYIKQLIATHKTKEVTVAWQGGKPTLMGVDFFQRAIAYQEKYRKPRRAGITKWQKLCIVSC
ncbi:MAG: hypothetical protein ACRDB1_13930 [Microcoleaceae cyanobacterium]